MGAQSGRALHAPAQPAERIERFFQASLLGLLTSGFLALAFSGYLDTATIGLTVIGLMARAVAVFGDFHDCNFPPAIANALTLSYIGFYPLDYMYLSREFIPATVHLVCFLSVVRVLSARTNRDYFFVKVLAFLELLGATLLSSNISFFIFLTMFLIFGVATFCCSEIRRSSQQPRRIAMPRVNFHARLAALTATITFGIVLMTAGLFVLLPRTARAAFQSFVPERYHVTGFANEVSLGQIGQIQQSSTPMLHVLIDGIHQHLPLKWRGGALSQFDGKRWYNPVGQNQTSASITVSRFLQMSINGAALVSGSRIRFASIRLTRTSSSSPEFLNLFRRISRCCFVPLREPFEPDVASVRSLSTLLRVSGRKPKRSHLWCLRFLREIRQNIFCCRTSTAES